MELFSPISFLAQSPFSTSGATDHVSVSLIGMGHTPLVDQTFRHLANTGVRREGAPPLVVEALG